MVVDNAILGN